MTGRDKSATWEMDPATRAAFGRLAEAWSKASEGVSATLMRMAPPVAPETFAALARTVDFRWLDRVIAESEQLPPCAVVDLPERGRRKGQIQAETECALAALNRLLKAAGAGADPTTIARGIFEGLGYKGDETLKNKADHLVKVFKRAKDA